VAAYPNLFAVGDAAFDSARSIRWPSEFAGDLIIADFIVDVRTGQPADFFFDTRRRQVLRFGHSNSALDNQL